MPLTALIANNNTIGGPRWGLVSPAEIARIDMMYGPFSAAYAGNSMGAVMEITTRLPEKLEGSINQTQALQTFSLYGTDKTYGTTQTTADVGDRFGKFAFWASGNYQDSHSQPLTLRHGARRSRPAPPAASPRRTSSARRRTCSAPPGLLHTGMTNAKVKAAYDLTPTLRAAYTFGYWKNDADAGVDPYSTASGQPTYAGQAGFASGYYDLQQRASRAEPLAAQRHAKRNWDFEAVGDAVPLRHRQAAHTDHRVERPARRSRRRPRRGARRHRLVHARRQGHVASGAKSPAHTISFGAHDDRYTLLNTTFNTPDWTTASTYSGVFTEGDGKTRTAALWVQDAWWITPALKLTVGGRYESWRALRRLQRQRRHDGHAARP